MGIGEDGVKTMVSLNAAPKEKPMTLRGIRESRAEGITRYRGALDGFRSIEDIANISSVKNAAFKRIKDSTTV